jgi:hypothetical protein
VGSAAAVLDVGALDVGALDVGALDVGALDVVTDVGVGVGVWFTAG